MNCLQSLNLCLKKCLMTYNALDPLVRNYLDLFRVREALAIIAAVAIWRVGASLTTKIFGRF